MHIENGAEISIETNPGTLTFEKLCSYREAGINRISMGLQAWQDRLLKYLGRIHNKNQFLRNYELALKAGFYNINVDLIFGIPGQTINEWAETISNITALDITRISCYSLKIEEGTPFGNLLEQGKLEQMDDETDRKMYWMAIENLDKVGFRQYEISNFSKKGFKCRHNLIYWDAEEYVGIGAGSHSYFEGKRYNNLVNISNYVSALKNNRTFTENIEEIDSDEQMSEHMILGLRLTKGIETESFKKKFGVELTSVYGKQIEKLEAAGLTDFDGVSLKLTKKGLDLANQAFVEFI
jgi:oxygen-independent coproporphyrinogen-3 oxidase